MCLQTFKNREVEIVMNVTSILVSVGMNPDSFVKYRMMLFDLVLDSRK